MQYSDSQKYVAEFIGTAFLVATVVGSGIMGEYMTDGDIAMTLFVSTFPSGAILYVLITMLGPISGGHINPAVTLVFALRREISAVNSICYVLSQIAGGLIGVVAVHLMFDQEVIQFSQKLRTGHPQWLSEAIATFGLIFTILVTLKFRSVSVALSVGLYITAATWFTASTSFANPALTIARCFTDTFAGIHPGNMPAFLISQIIGALLAWLLCNWLLVQHSKQES